MKKFKDFLNENIDNFEIDDEEIDERTQLIKDLMELQLNDPLKDKLDLDDDNKKLLKKINDKLFDRLELDDISVNELKLFKEATLLENKKRKLIYDNFKSFEKIQKMVMDILNELNNDNDL